MEQHVRGKWEHLHICVSAELAQGPTAELAAAFSPRVRRVSNFHVPHQSLFTAPVPVAPLGAMAFSQF